MKNTSLNVTILKILARIDTGLKEKTLQNETLMSPEIAVGGGMATVPFLQEMAQRLFTAEGYETLRSLKLKLKDFSTVIQCAMELITGEDESEGE